jgi:hypothetical protein
MTEFAAVLKDRDGNIIATGGLASDPAVIAQAERQSLDRMQKAAERPIAERYAAQYERENREGAGGNVRLTDEAG